MFVQSYDWIGEIEEQDLIELANEVFTKSFAREIELYIRVIKCSE